MIFHRLAVSHFKGLKNVDIRFAPKGITLVEGPNEIGKSSLVHALTTLFEEPFSRTRRKIEHLIPNDGSGTPEILLEAESGEYRFTYRKSYIDDKAAELIVAEPHPMRYEGNQAQERFDGILNETLDRSLWKALMLQQGSAVGLPEVKDQQALMTALDNAVAGPGGRTDAESLYARVCEEYGKYYHSGHSGELQRLRDLRDAAEGAARGAEDIRERMAELEEKIAAVKRLRLLLRSLNEREAAELRTKGAFEERLREIETLEKALGAETTKLEIAGQNRIAAERGLEPRKKLVDAEAEARASLERIMANLETARLAGEDAARVAREREAEWRRRDRARKQSEKLAALRRADHEHLRDRFDLEHMRERKRRIDASAARAAKARAEIADNPVTEAAAAEVRAAAENAERARIRRDSAVPRVRLDAVAPCDVVIGEDALRMEAGETRELPVNGTASVRVPGLLSLTVTAGVGEDDLDRQLAEAGEKLRELLGKYGLEVPDDAPRLLERRREAARTLEDHKRVEEENLRDLAYAGEVGSLVERILELEEKVAAYERNRVADIPPPPSLDLAKAERDGADSAHSADAKACGEAEAVWKAAEAAGRLAKDELLRLETDRSVTERELEHLRRSLAGLREGAADEELAKAFAGADAAYSDAARAVAVVGAKLEELEPELVRERLETLVKAMAKTAAEKSEARGALAGLTVELEILGGNGLNEKMEEAEADLAYRNRLLGAELRRAEAARLLHQVIVEARERSQKAYLVPLKNQIEELAKSVYATDVGVELTPDLQIARRVENGRAVAFAQLSGGAREQFSLIHRAACSLAVAKDGGVPLILDDALGYSDADRLIGMNEVLSRAARKCQIIILTCMPSRYGYIEPAARVNMEELTR